MNNKHRYSEIFFSPQGEGVYTGVPTVWYRSFLCNFQCQGFGQENPRDESTWVYDYKDINLDNIHSMEELPVFKRGCDSAYSWAKRYMHLAPYEDTKAICDKFENLITHELNPNGKFMHETSKQPIHLAFTGGEPLLKHGQAAMFDIINELIKRNNLPKHVTVETNGTQKLSQSLYDLIYGYYAHNKTREWFWSCSPKLSVSGEKWDDAIHPEILKTYNELSPYGQLKYVVDNTQQSWDEVAKATELYRKAGINWDVWIMPVSALKEDQERVQKEICLEAIKRGYYFAARVHCWIFGNTIGT